MTIFKSPPAQNALLPIPVSITAFTLSSFNTVLKIIDKSETSSRFNALYTSGLFSLTIIISESISTIRLVISSREEISKFNYLEKDYSKKLPEILPHYEEIEFNLL